MATFDIKIVLVGHRGSGNSALLQRLLTDRYQEQEPTYSCEFGAKRESTNELASAGSAQGLASMPVWTGWQAMSQGTAAMTSAAEQKEAGAAFVQGADAVVVCFDPTNRASWDALRAWVLEVRAMEPSTLVFLCATKCDLLAPAQRAQQPQPGAEPEVRMEVSVERVRRSSTGPGGQPQQRAGAAGASSSNSSSSGSCGRRNGSQTRLPVDGPLTPLKADRPPLLDAAPSHAASERQGAAQQVQQAPDSKQAPPSLPSAFAATAALPASGSPGLAAAMQGVPSSTDAQTLRAGQRGYVQGVAHTHHMEASASGAASPAMRPMWGWMQPCDAVQTAGGSDSEGAQSSGEHGLHRGFRLRFEGEKARDMPPQEGHEEDQEALRRTMQHAAVPEAAIQHYCRAESLPLFEVSSRTGQGVAAAFSAIAQQAFVVQQQRQQARQASAPAGQLPERPPAGAEAQQQSRQQQQQQQQQQSGTPPLPPGPRATPSGRAPAGPNPPLSLRLPSHAPAPVPMRGGREAAAGRRSSRGSTAPWRSGRQHEFVIDGSQLVEGRRDPPQDEFCRVA
ncbi:Ras-related protein Rab-24 [Chlorella vulgaris]